MVHLFDVIGKSVITTGGASGLGRTLAQAVIDLSITGIKEVAGKIITIQSMSLRNKLYKNILAYYKENQRYPSLEESEALFEKWIVLISIERIIKKI